MENKISKIIDYIIDNEQYEGYFGYKDKEFKLLSKLSYCADCLFYHSDELNDIDDVIRTIEEKGIWQQEVIYVHNAYKYVWEYGLDKAQEICNEYGIDEPLFHIEQVATACLQRSLSEQLWEMRDELEKIWNETPIDEE
jgi:hypothetical protein